MHEADSLAGLAEDLRALTDRERRAVLAALSPFERAQVGALLDAAANPAAAEPAAPASALRCRTSQGEKRL